jgi:hypothetical protein
MTTTTDGPRADDAAAAVLASKLITYCKSQLADVKCPRTIDFRPRSLATRPASSTSGCYNVRS